MDMIWGSEIAECSVGRGPTWPLCTKVLPINVSGLPWLLVNKSLNKMASLACSLLYEHFHQEKRIPDGPFHNFRASRSGHREISCSSGVSCGKLVCSKAVKDSVGQVKTGSSIICWLPRAICRQRKLAQSDRGKKSGSLFVIDQYWQTFRKCFQSLQKRECSFMPD